MIDWESKGPLANSPIEDGEELSHFLEHRKEIKRQGDKCFVAPKALIPYKHTELSVTRKLKLTEGELWEAGEFVVVGKKHLTLFGRADFHAADSRGLDLEVLSEEPPWNHANLLGWPSVKSAQMQKAIDLAAFSECIPLPASAE